MGEVRWDGVCTSEDKDTPSAKGGVYMGDCGKSFGRGERVGGEERSAVDDRHLVHVLVIDTLR